MKHPGEQQTLRRMLRLRERGEVFQAIADQLNDGRRAMRNGNPWTRQTVWRTMARHEDREEVRGP